MKCFIKHSSLPNKSPTLEIPRNPSKEQTRHFLIWHHYLLRWWCSVKLLGIPTGPVHGIWSTDWNPFGHPPICGGGRQKKSSLHFVSLSDQSQIRGWTNKPESRENIIFDVWSPHTFLRQVAERWVKQHHPLSTYSSIPRRSTLHHPSLRKQQNHPSRFVSLPFSDHHGRRSNTPERNVWGCHWQPNPMDCTSWIPQQMFVLLIHSSRSIEQK